MRQQTNPGRQQSFIKGQRTGSLQRVEEDDGDAIAVDGRVEDARLHDVQRLRQDSGGGAG